jgi:ABC-2 type transport system permease protein
MSAALLIAGRELKAYLRSPLGYVLAAAVLLGEGLWFVAKALGPVGEKRLSAQVLIETFHAITGGTILACLVISMRLIAYEAEHGTMILLKTSPIRDRDVVLGKFLSAMTVLLCLTALSGYMPALVFVHGKVSAGHVLTGYLGVLLLGSAVISVGLFGSALAKNQVIGFIVSGLLVLVMLLMWMVAKVTDPPIQEFLDGLALHHVRQRDFMTGVLRLDNVVFYVALSLVFLLASTKTLEARRWR